MMSKKIAISTGGGDAPGLNAVIRAVTLTAIREYGWEVIGLRNGFDGVLAKEPGIPLNEQLTEDILREGGTILGAANRGNPFKRPITQPDGSVIYEDVSDQVIDHLKTMGVDALIMVGGDGTMAIAQQLYTKGVRLVGVPKTIDNDLGGTDRTFGFDTALNIAMDALDRLHTTAESHHRVMVLEVMGRNSGWIALQAGVAGGADIILIPEIPFDIDIVCEKVRMIRRSGRLHSLVVVAEGAAEHDGSKYYVDAAQKRLGGIGDHVGKLIMEKTEAETRVTVLGHIQRGGSPTVYDRWLGTRFGANVLRLIKEEKWGYMIGLRGEDITEVKIADAIAALKRVDPASEPIHTARNMGISFGAAEDKS